MDEVRESLKGQHEPLRSPEEKFARRVGCFPKLDIKRCESARHPHREIRTEALLGRFARQRVRLLLCSRKILSRIDRQGVVRLDCPYGNIFMVPNQRRRIEVPDHDHPGETTMIAQLKAATCDLCDAEGDRSSPKPQCVASCPHDAASPVTGPQLLQRVTERRAREFGVDIL